ncbi:MAG: DNA gyrase subunit A, partial [Clostridiales bacterium]|nr:DNA gyrase subunit A [Clostridiales bacterium]
REKLQTEYDELENKIAYYRDLLADPIKLEQVLKDELTAIRDKYGDARRTEIQDVEEEINLEDLISEEENIFTLTNGGYIKRIAATEYRSQGRGGKGIKAMSTKEDDFVETVFSASSHDYLMFFTSTGRVFRKKGYNIPEATRTAKGTNIINVIPIEPGEKVTAVIHTGDIESTDKLLNMVTKNGTIKRLNAEQFKNVRTSGIRAISLDEGDELVSVIETSGSDNILIATHDGYAICFSEDDVRLVGRTAMGVRGIKLRDGDYVVGAVRADRDGMLLSVTENGYGKRTAISEYMRGDDVQHRGGMGIKNYNVTAKTGKVSAARVVSDSDDVLIISDDGTMIRTGAETISVLGRSPQGV